MSETLKNNFDSEPNAQSEPSAWDSLKDVPFRPHLNSEIVKEVISREERDFSKFKTKDIKIDRIGNRFSVTRNIEYDQDGNPSNAKSEVFDNFWDAKLHTIDLSESMERIEEDPVLSFNTQDAKVSFSSLDKFDPTPSLEFVPTEPSPSIKKLLESDIFGKYTNIYSESIKDPDYSSKIFDFVSDFVKKDVSMEREKNYDLAHLTPREAIEIATNTVISLTKYDYDSIQPGAENRADNMSAIDILEEGKNHHNDPSWRGNGICRNFSDLTRMVFDSLKSHQGRNSLLLNTYCICHGSTEDLDYNPEAKTDYKNKSNEGHEWNSFIQVSHDGESMNMFVADVTWAEKDSITHEISGLDYTLPRLRQMIGNLSKNLPEGESGIKETQKIVTFFNDRLNESINKYMSAKNPNTEARAENAINSYGHQILDTLEGKDLFSIISREGNISTNLPILYERSVLTNIPKNQVMLLSEMCGADEKKLSGVAHAYVEEKLQDKYYKDNISHANYSVHDRYWDIANAFHFKNPVFQSQINQELEKYKH